MKALTQARQLNIAVVGLLTVGTTLTSGLFGVGLQSAQANDVFPSVKRNCEKVSGGYYCQNSDLSRARSEQLGRRIERSQLDDRGYDRVFERSEYERNEINGRAERSKRDVDSRFRHSGRRYGPGRLYEGTVIETRAFRKDRIEIERGDSRSLTLVIDRDVYSDDTNVLLIPKNSRIEGRLRSHDGGIRFVADDLFLPNGRRYDLDARSETIYPRRNPGRQISSAATTILIGSVLGQDLGAGSLGNIFSRSRGRGRIVKIRPNKDLDLRLTDDLRIR